MLTNTSIPGYTIRIAQPEDTALILSFIKHLAVYEKMEDDVVATEELLYENLFIKKQAEVVIGDYEGHPVAFALFFHNFSTFLGRPGLYLEDLYVQPKMRGKGIGKVMLSYLAKLAKERNCGRMEWTCLDWNEPSIQFYRQMGAIPMKEWTVYRVSDDSLNDLAGEFKIVK